MRRTSEARSEATDADLLGELGLMHSNSFGWALLCCNHRRDEAEEVLQTAYLKLVEGSARFSGESSLRTWFFGVIRRTASEQRRRRWMRNQIFDRWVVNRPAQAATPDPEAVALETEGSRALLQALARLSARQREVLHLVFYQELTIEEASRILKIRLGTARTHFERGKRELRKMLAGPGAQHERK
jgi:RNA polymerase sigma-70 factor (ECF subfamily)